MFVCAIDIEPKSNDSTPINTFRFNFFPDGSPALPEKTPPPSEPARSQISFTGQGSSFAFNFQLPSVTPVEHMETTETLDTRSSGSQEGLQEEKSSVSLEANAPPEPLGPLKGKKKKKKSGKKSPSDCAKQQNSSSREERQGGESAELVSDEVFPLCEWACCIPVHWVTSVSLSEWRRAAEQTAGLVHGAAETRNEVPQDYTQTEYVVDTEINLYLII